MSTNGGGANHTRTMTSSEFKAKSLTLMDNVAENGGEIIIAKPGKPSAKLTAHRERQRPKSLLGSDQGRLKLRGDIMSSVDIEWEADVNPNRLKYNRSFRKAQDQGRGKPHQGLAAASAACTGCPCHVDPAASGAGLNLYPAEPRLHPRLLSGQRVGFRERSSTAQLDRTPDSPNQYRAI